MDKSNAELIYAQQLRARIDELERENARLREGMVHAHTANAVYRMTLEAVQRGSFNSYFRHLCQGVLRHNNVGAPFLALLSAARDYRDAWQGGQTFDAGPLAIGEHWDRLRAAIEALEEKV